MPDRRPVKLRVYEDGAETPTRWLRLIETEEGAKLAVVDEDGDPLRDGNILRIVSADGGAIHRCEGVYRGFGFDLDELGRLKVRH